MYMIDMTELYKVIQLMNQTLHKHIQKILFKSKNE
jgi:hypothetical protein